MRTLTILEALASALQARENCRKARNEEWFERWTDEIDAIMKTAPSGGGIDSGTALELQLSNDGRLVFTCGFHHMNDGGFYDGWTDHTITVCPSLAHGFYVKIGGRNRNDIKEYLADVYDGWLRGEWRRDLCGSQLRQCGTCHTSFYSSSYQAAYCSERCRFTMQKRRYRERKRRDLSKQEGEECNEKSA